MRRRLIKLLSLVLLALLGSVGLAHRKESASNNSAVALPGSLPDKSHRFKIRTITAGVNLKNTSDETTIQSAIGFLRRAKRIFEDAGYEIQTLRIATQPLPEYLKGKT